MRVSPVNFSLTSPTLHRGDGVQLLRSEDGEIGLYGDKITSRHFFIVAKPLNSLKFSLKMTVILVISQLKAVLTIAIGNQWLYQG